MPPSAENRLRLALLERLRAAGEPVSGGDLARALGVSRTAVWKQVQALRRLGYRIAGNPGSGYRLEQAPDLPTPEEVLPLLRTRRLGRPYRFHPVIGSTNLEARRLALSGAPEGTTVVADCQTRGRGRRGRPWLTPPGTGLAVSVVLRPELPPAGLGRLTLLTAVAVRRAIRAVTGLAPAVKWPNDLLLDGRKVCGILLELAAQQDAIEFVVVGIGVNVNQAPDQFPPDLAATAGSLRQFLGRPVPRPRLVAEVLAELEAAYDAWRAGQDAPWWSEWREACPHLGQRVRVTGPAGTWVGRALDVSPDGALLLQPDGAPAPVRVLAGDVSLRPE